MERVADERENSSSITTSPTTTSSNHGAAALGQRLSPRPVFRSELNPYPVTFVQANAATFKQIVQMLTGSVNPASSGTGGHSIRPIRTVQKKQGFKLYERRSGLKNNNNNGLTISPPLLPNPSRNAVERLSPSILDFPSLALSPVTPLTGAELYSPSARSSSEEDKAIAEKGFYLHPSPRQIDGDEPRLLPLFPVMSPRASFESKT